MNSDIEEKKTQCNWEPPSKHLTVLTKKTRFRHIKKSLSPHTKKPALRAGYLHPFGTLRVKTRFRAGFWNGVQDSNFVKEASKSKKK